MLSILLVYTPAMMFTIRPCRSVAVESANGIKGDGRHQATNLLISILLNIFPFLSLFFLSFFVGKSNRTGALEIGVMRIKQRQAL